MWAPELHGYWSWQFAWFGCNTRWVPKRTQIQVYSAHEFPNPALPTGFPAEHMHMPWCECQTARAPSSFYAILATYSTLPKVAKWCSSASERFKTLASSLAEDQQMTWACWTCFVEIHSPDLAGCSSKRGGRLVLGCWTWDECPAIKQAINTQFFHSGGSVAKFQGITLKSVLELLSSQQAWTAVM